MAKKINQRLLNEELKKFRLLSEYSFYTEEPKKDDDLILGSNVDEAPADAPADTAADAPVDDSKTAANAADAGTEGGDEAPAETGDEATSDEAPAGDEMTGDDMDFSTGGDETGGDEAPASDTMGDTGGDEVEVDVTQLVKGTEDAKKSAELSFVKSSELLDKFSELERRVSAMDSITSKIDTLEKEIVKRNPTPVEKLEMRSLSSFPYNVKLTDYWKDVEGYDATGGEQKPKEYVLTQDDVDFGYTDASIKNSFDVPEDYEEEDY